MKQARLWMIAVILTCDLMLTSCSNDDTPIKQERQHTEAGSELIRLMDGNPEVTVLLEKSELLKHIDDET